jgi:parallel beta-helix repeat protein
VKKNKIVFFIIFVISFGFNLQLTSESNNVGHINKVNSDSALTINGNSELEAISSSGTGTINDPYIIQSYNIVSSNSNGNNFELKNTDKYAIIRNINVYQASKNGFHIENVTNAKFEDNYSFSSKNNNFAFINSQNLSIIKNKCSIEFEISIFEDTGFYFLNSNNNVITNNTSESNSKGFVFSYSNENFISNNTAKENSFDSFKFTYSNYNSLTKNLFIGSYSSNSITLIRSNYNNISENNIMDNSNGGISLSSSKGNILLNNNISQNGIKITGDKLEEVKQEKISNNLMKFYQYPEFKISPILFFQDIDELKINQTYFQLILINCSFITIENKNFEYNSEPLQILFSKAIVLKNNYFSEVPIGIHFIQTNYSKILNNTFNYGSNPMQIENSHFNNISFNTVTSWIIGSKIEHSSNNFFKSNKFEQSGFSLFYSHNNTFEDNSVKNGQDGFFLFYSDANTFISCYSGLNDNGFVFENSNNNILIKITSLRNNFYGIKFFQSNFNLITNSYISENLDYGLYMKFSTSNSVFFNVFNNNRGNDTQAFSDNKNNSLDNGTLGNYWSNYIGSDIDNDSIGDTSYLLDGGVELLDQKPIENKNLISEIYGISPEIVTTTFSFASFPRVSTSVSTIIEKNSSEIFLSQVILVSLAGIILAVYFVRKRKYNQPELNQNKVKKKNHLFCFNCGMKTEKLDIFCQNCGIKLV